MGKINLDDLMGNKASTVEPSVIPEQVTTVLSKPDLSPVHPLNRPVEEPDRPSDDTIPAAGFGQVNINTEELAYQYVLNSFEKFIPKYEQGFCPSFKRMQDGGWLIVWNYTPDYAESTLMKYHSQKQTMDVQSFRDKVDQVIEERVEERDMPRVKQFVEVVGYDVEACRPILEGDSGFLSEIASMDVVDFNLKYLQVKELQELNKTMYGIQEALIKLTQGIPT